MDTPTETLGVFEEKKSMYARFNERVKRGREWFMSKAKSPHAERWLGVLSFTESSFFPIAPDLLLLAMLLASAKHWFRLATITTVTSVLGGIAGYYIGALFYDMLGRHLVEFYGFQDEFMSLGKTFADNTFWTIFTAAFTPIPYKIFTIAGGFFRVNLVTFVIASIVGRALRFYAIAYICKLYGHRLGNVIEKYFNAFSLLFVLLIFVGYFFLALNVKL